MTRRIFRLLCILPPRSSRCSAAAPAKVKRPTVTLVSPMRLSVGDTITIRGRNFNKVARPQHCATLPRAERALRARQADPRHHQAKLVLKMPASLAKLFATRSGDAVSTRFTLQVLLQQPAQRYAHGTHLPVIVPATAARPAGAGAEETGRPGGGGAVTPRPRGFRCGTGSDWDGDLLPNTLRGHARTDPCNKETDGDGVRPMGSESAVDLNDDEFQNPTPRFPTRASGRTRTRSTAPTPTRTSTATR